MKAATATAFHHLTASSVLDSGRSSRSITRCLLLFSQIPRSISFITRDLVSVLDRFSLPRVPLPFVSDFDWCLPNRESLLSSNARILSLRFGIHCFVKHRNLRESFHLSLEWKWPEHGRTIQRSFEHEYNLPRNCLPFRRNLCLFNGSVVTNFLAVPNIYIYTEQRNISLYPFVNDDFPREWEIRGYMTLWLPLSLLRTVFSRFDGSLDIYSSLLSSEIVPQRGSSKKDSSIAWTWILFLETVSKIRHLTTILR